MRRDKGIFILEKLSGNLLEKRDFSRIYDKEYDEICTLEIEPLTLSRIERNKLSVVRKKV